MMLYNFCMKGVLGQNKKWQIGKIFCQNWLKKGIFAQKRQKTAPLLVNRGTWRPEKFTQGQLDDALRLVQQESSRSEQKVADRDNILSKIGENMAFLLKNDI